MQRWVAIFMLLCMCGTTAWTEEDGQAGMETEGIWRTYRYVHGLASNNVIGIFQDRKGAMWFRTTDGVSRYDGKSWKTYTTKDGLAINNLRAIFQDSPKIVNC